jgi:ABC-2 type transport system ATP-binding protein
VTRFASHKLLAIEVAEGSDLDGVDLAALTDGEVVEQTSTSATVRVEKRVAPAAAARLLDRLDVVDLTITDPPIERVIEDVFAAPAVEGA